MTLLQSLSLIHTQAVMKLKSQANMLVLSYLWWVLEPLLMAVMFYLVFKYLRGDTSKDFFTFLIIGQTTFLWFSKSVTTASSSLITNKGLINQRVIPKIIFAMTDIQETFYKQLVVFLVLFFILAMNGYNSYAYWGQIIGLVILQYILICGISFILTIFVTYMPDFRMIIQLLMMGLMFSSGIFFDIHDIVDPTIKSLLLNFNPLALIIDGYRQALMHGNIVEWGTLIPAFFISLIALFTGGSGLFILSNKLTKRLFV